jgi:hypothetical protein
VRRLGLFSAFLVPGSVAAAEPPPASPPISAGPSHSDARVVVPGARNSVTGEPCRPTNVIPAGEGDRLGPQKLIELPPADLHLTVLRQVDGCNEPVIARYNIGSGPVPLPRADSPRAPRPLRPTPL